MTSKDDIREWFQRGIKDDAAFMIIVCDTFDYEDYPMFCTAEDFEEKEKRATSNMQKIMEVYDLSMDIEEQINQRRVFNRPKQKVTE